MTLDRHECFPVFITCNRINNANNATHYVTLGQKRRESSKHNYYIISPKVIIKAIIIIFNSEWRCLGCMSFSRWWKTENIHVDLALLVGGPTLLSTHAPLPPSTHPSPSFFPCFPFLSLPLPFALSFSSHFFVFGLCVCVCVYVSSYVCTCVFGYCMCRPMITYSILN